jgi:hypothetical protein
LNLFCRVLSKFLSKWDKDNLIVDFQRIITMIQELESEKFEFFILFIEKTVTPQPVVLFKLLNPVIYWTFFYFEFQELKNFSQTDFFKVFTLILLHSRFFYDDFLFEFQRFKKLLKN